MRIVSIGECMVELSGAGDDLWRSGYAGDTFNTAWYARALLPDCDVDYVTCVGQDPVSSRMVDFMKHAGVGTQFIWRHPVRGVGLYMIDLKDGERSFTYWRDQSAARTLADRPDDIRKAVQNADYVYLSGITLGILSQKGRDDLWDALQGSTVVFDPNLRPKLWPDIQTMRQAVSLAAQQASVILPSFEDEADHFSDPSPMETAQRYADLGAKEIVVKNGGSEMVLYHNGSYDRIDLGKPTKPVDTTGAGDSFNGAYMAARLAGHMPIPAARAAHQTAVRVIGHRGALLPMRDLT